MSDHSSTKSHSRHISLKQAEQMGLKVFNLSDDKKLQDKVLSIHHSTIISLSQTIENKL